MNCRLLALSAAMAALVGCAGERAVRSEAVPSNTTEVDEGYVVPGDPAQGTLPRPAIEEGSADALLQAFLDAQELALGCNEQDDGAVFVVSQGVAAIGALPGDRRYGSSRQAAFDKAMLQAKAAMAKYLEQTLETAATYDVLQEMPATTSAEAAVAKAVAAQPAESLLGKTVKLVDLKLDAALKAEGYDASAAKTAAAKAAAEAAAKKAVLTETFRQVTRTAANVAVSGVQAFYTVEAQTSDKRGEIGVVAIWSPRLAEMASALAYGTPVTNLAGKRKIREQVPSDADTLLSTFGVQQRIDEKGRLTLVAFGQAGAATASAMAKQAAYQQAQLNAEAAIRAFAGEQVALAQVAETAEERRDLADGTELFADQSRYEQHIAAVAGKMSISGIAQLRRWTATHPVDGQPVYGTVVTWSPSAAALAQKAKAAIQGAAKGKPGAATSTRKTTESFRRGGTAADRDAL